MARTEGQWQKGIGLISPSEDVPILLKNSYLNFGGAVIGVSGYGFRDNGGIMEYKNSGGSWAGVGSGGGGGGGVTSVATGTGLTGGTITTTGTISLDSASIASLSKADTASQPGHTHVAANITDFATAVAATASVTANTAKVSNATHTGDATGSTALTLATVNSNVGSFTNANVTVNAKGLVTAISNGSGGGGSGITRTVVVTSSNVTAGATALTDYVYLIAGAHTVTLPTAVANTNLYTIKNNHTVAVSVATTSSQTIDGSTTIILKPTESVDVISDGANFNIV